MSGYKLGQFVRAVGGQPARALGEGRLCLYRTGQGRLVLAVIRQVDVCVRDAECPTIQELHTFLEQHDNRQMTLSQTRPGSRAGRRRG